MCLDLIFTDKTPRYKNWENAASQPIVSGAPTVITTDSAVSNGLFKSSLTISSITVDLAAKYKCIFTVDGVDYASEGTVEVRLVTRTPAADTVYSYANAEYVMTCVLAASDSAESVTWTGPGGAAIDDGAVPTVNGDDYILTLTNPTAADTGAYTCAFAFAAGTAPTAIFPEININLVTMISPADTYSTIGTTVTISCEVVSNLQLVLTFWDGTTENAATEITYDTDSNGKTIATYDITVGTDTADATYTCRKSETEYSATSTTLTVLRLTDSFETLTRGELDAVVTLTCNAAINAEITNPGISWYKDGSPATETAVEDFSSGTTFESKIEVTVTTDSDGYVYKCVAAYSGLAASTDLTSETTTITLSRKSI